MRRAHDRSQQMVAACLLAVPIALAATGAAAQIGCPPDDGARVTPGGILDRLGLPADSTGLMLYEMSPAPSAAVPEPPVAGFLFGTVHLGPPFVTRAPPQALLAIRRATAFVTEVVVDAHAQREYETRAHRAPRAPATSLERQLAPELFQRYLSIAARRGIPPAASPWLEPWAAFGAIGRPPVPPGATMDEMLQGFAARIGKKLIGLQSVGELVSALDALPEEDQIAILADTICQQGRLHAYYRDLLEIYSTGIPEALAAFTAAGREDDPVMIRLDRRMVGERNVGFEQRLLEILGRETPFVALGAQHLAGPSGLIERLRARGWRVERAE